MSGWMPETLTSAAASCSRMRRMTSSENAGLRAHIVCQPDPVVPAYWSISSPRSLVFWCPWCETVHCHGAGGGDGHRGAHCHEKTSPLFGRGLELLHAGVVVNSDFAPRCSQADLARIWDALNWRRDVVAP
jgi:hypothetical protein